MTNINSPRLPTTSARVVLPDSYIDRLHFVVEYNYYGEERINVCVHTVDTTPDYAT